MSLAMSVCVLMGLAVFMAGGVPAAAQGKQPGGGRR